MNPFSTEISKTMPGPEFAIQVIKQAMKDDEEYAWGWHCNIAMSFFDEGGTHEASNKSAARFMKNCFDIDTTKNKHYQYK